MTFFEVNIPPIPNDVHIHHIAHTPILKRAKILIIVVCLLNFSLVGLSVLEELHQSHNLSHNLSWLLSYADIITSLSFIALAIACFYLSKLSLRKRLFHLCIISFILIVLTYCMLWLFGEQNTLIISIGSLIYSLFNLYISWQGAKELSFITHDHFFFKGAKISIASLIPLFVALFTILLGLNVENSAIAVLGAIIGVVGIVCMFAGVIMLIIAICRMRQIIAYGEGISNPL
ncbi:hypothetical protein [Helicobacter marmotae]|uniref:Uncharacterized protein n=1 Tax=Helicobacter marmotae TaxID=152490 RepID=A0A3D8I6F6_9HELI|nr:hypothetical protein [Helicobacter marmotae]RDU60555.1 hypothetical protein CQA63_03170 [Helicobacter marmotae]